jgi:hypothetical protein
MSFNSVKNWTDVWKLVLIQNRNLPKALEADNPTKKLNVSKFVKQLQ